MISGGIQKFLIFNCLFLGLAGSYGVAMVRQEKRQSKSAELVISAAASMQQVLEEIRLLYNQQYPHTKIVFNFGSSGALQYQIEQGAPVDIFISAAPQQMNRLAQKKLLIASTRRNIARNQMVLVVPRTSQPDLPLAGFTDLTNLAVDKIALGEPNSVPAGQYAREILIGLNIIDAVTAKAIYGKDVRQVFSYVATGNIDAGIVYRTDALDAKEVEIIATAPETVSSPVVYPAAVVRDSQNIPAAQQMLQFLLSEEAQAIFQRHGFLPAGDRLEDN
ncbi:MAG: molybdate ABC transporter substrate-binding protein [Cyanobacteria bacterium J06623_7]